MDGGRDDREITGFDYFVLRLSRSGGEQGPVSGIIERLGSGDKRRFDTGEQLMHLVTRWADRGPGREEASS